MLNTRFALFAIPLLASCYYEPPREYTVPVIIPIDNTTPPNSSIIAASSAVACDNISCDGNLSVSGQISASSFLEGAPLIVDNNQVDVWQVPTNATTIIVYSSIPTTVIELPLSTEAPGRIVRIKAMSGSVTINGGLDETTGKPEQIDNESSFFLAAVVNSPPPAITLQAYVDEFVPPGAPKRSGWAVLSVYP
jgi:hypothetical protein